MPRIAVIGCGSIGRRHIGNLLALGCEVYAFDISLDALTATVAAYPGIRSAGRDYQLMSALKAGECDALVIATPWDCHLVPALEAAMYRVPMFIEKPLGSLNQLESWREFATRDLPVTQVGYMLRFHPDVVAMKQHVPDPVVGTFDCTCDARLWPGSAYGPMPLEMSHEIDLALWFGAPLSPLSGWHEGHEVGVTFGESWSVYLFERSTLYHRAWSVAGSRTRVQCSYDSPEALGAEMYRAELAHFLDCVREQKPTRCPLADGLRVLEVCAQVEALTKA